MPARPLPDKFLVAFSFAGEQRELVRAIAETVEAQLGRGNVFLDEWYEHYIAGADGDLKLQEIYAARCTLAVVCVSKNYGGKPWTLTEHEAIRARQMKARGSTDPRERDAILPLRVGEGDVPGIQFTAIVPEIRGRSATEAAELIIDRLRLLADPKPASATQLPPAGWPSTPPRLRWPMADHHGVREAFGSLLTQDSQWRFLPIVGSSETGKSHITRQMLANAAPLLKQGVAFGRFDFKGTGELEAEVNGFVRFLQIKFETLKPGQSASDHLGQILNLLKLRAAPALLIFDTYEQAGETRDWVEKQLLPELLLSAWLRVVIAGQCVPHSDSALWFEAAAPTIQLRVPPPQDWLEFGKQHRTDLTLADVEAACRLAINKPSLLAQLLGPKGGAL